MKPLLFFDSDYILKKYIEKNPFSDFRPIFFNKSINNISQQDLNKYCDAEIISCFTHSTPLSNQKLDNLPNLKLIATRSTGFNHIDLKYCRDRNIKVVNVPTYGATTVAEFSFALLLSLSRKLIQAKNDMSQNRLNIKDYLGFDLFGKTIGIIGTGSIGRHMIKIAKGFGMKILAFDKYRLPEFQGLYVNDINDIYQASDIISLHIPSTKKNHHLLNKKSFKKMKKGVFIINTARGDLIDTQALFDALKNGTVAGAGLDVLENEDFLIHDDFSWEHHNTDTDFLLDSAMNLKLLQFNNVVITPHIAFDSRDAINRINKTTWENINAFNQGYLINQV